MQMQEIEVLSFEVEGVPSLDHPAIDDEMSTGEIITESNQKNYYKPFERSEDECSLVGYDAEIAHLYTNKNGTTVMIIATSSKQPLTDLSDVTILDHITNETYAARIIGECRL